MKDFANRAKLDKREKFEAAKISNLAELVCCKQCSSVAKACFCFQIHIHTSH